MLAQKQEEQSKSTLTILAERISIIKASCEFLTGGSFTCKTAMLSTNNKNKLDIMLIILVC